MRVVDRAKFMTLPPGTWFCKFEPFVFDELRVKGATIFNDAGAPIDWTYTSVFAVDCERGQEYMDALYALERTQNTGQSVDIGHSESRDGCFEDQQMFVVLEADDVFAIQRLASKSLLTEPFNS